MTFTAVLGPRLMPLTTSRGRRGRSWLTASFTQSAGVPLTAQAAAAPASSAKSHARARTGSRTVMACPTALCSSIGATT